MNQKETLDKLSLWTILESKMNLIQAEINKIIYISEQSQAIVQQKQEELDSTFQLLLKLKEEPDEANIDISNYLTEEEYNNYLKSQQEPQMLCEFDIPLYDWFEWFYNELPFITDKHLTFIDEIGTKYDISDLILANLVKVNHKTQTIYIARGMNQPYNISMNLNGMSLYQLLNVSYQKEFDTNLIKQWEMLNE